MDEAHPQPTVFEGELKSYQLKVNSHAITCSEFKLTCTYVCLLIEFGACVASGGWVPMGQGAAIAITPQGGRTPTGLPTCNPATSPPVPTPPPPHYTTIAPVILRLKQGKKKNPKKEGETLNQESRGRQENQEKRYTTYTTRMPRHALLTKLRVHCKQNVGTWPVHVPKQHTTGQESAPMLLNNGKRYKCNSTTKSQHATKERQNTRDHSS